MYILFFISILSNTFKSFDSIENNHRSICVFLNSLTYRIRHARHSFTSPTLGSTFALDNVLPIKSQSLSPNSEPLSDSIAKMSAFRCADRISRMYALCRRTFRYLHPIFYKKWIFFGRLWIFL